MAHDVFISHSAHNREVADAICEALEKTGIRCWVAPRDVRPGRSFPGEITRAIQQSKVMVMVFSSHSNNSEQVLREIQLATDSRLVIIRFRIEDVALTDDLRYFLSSPHWLDALTPPLSKHIERLQLAIKELLDQSVEVTGKDVTADDVAVAAPPEVTPAAAPPAPVAAAPVMPPPLPVAAPAPKKPEPVAPKAFNPWPLLAIAAVVICAAIIGVIFLFMRQPKAKQPQASTAPSQSAQTPVATTKRPSPPATKVTQNAPPPAKAPKATPAADVQSPTESESEPASAFERAGTLKRPAEPKSPRKKEPKNEPKSAFDRVGGNIGSDEPKTEPSPDD
jgi:TIR domain